MPPRAPATAAEDLIERLTRLEEQIRSLSGSVERLATRDVDLDQGLRTLAERMQTSLNEHSQEFRDSLDRIGGKFASRDEMAMVRALLLAAFGTLSAFALHHVTGGG
jgi:TolA-binding protein